MGIIQQNTGVFDGTSFTASLASASSASNGVVLIIAGNTTITTPASWTLRTSQVNFMGHYMFDRAGASLTSVAVTNSAGQGTWWMAEIASGTHDISTSANNSASGTTYNTPNLTPTAGTREVLASIASTAFTANQARTVSGWTNSFVEQADLCQTLTATDEPMQGVASLDNITTDGVTVYSTTTTYSANSVGRSALIGAYVTSTGGAAPAPPRYPTMAPYRS